MKIFGIISGLVLILFSACVKEVDFELANDIELTPAYTIPLIYSKIPQTLLVSPSGVEASRITDIANIGNLDKFIADKLEKIELNLEINNPFDRKFLLDFIFLNNLDIETYRINQIIINENQNAFKVKEEILLANNKNILNTTKIELTFELLPSSNGSIININTAKIFEFKSAGTLYFRVN
ncbi:MAG: hypothetical protein ACK5H1_06735 [Tenacibaculum sp.]